MSKLSGFAKRKMKLKKEDKIRKFKLSFDMFIFKNNQKNNGK